ncbi:MAG: polysaccharide deacetylase family protein [Brumimicrobium sp.]
MEPVKVHIPKIAEPETKYVFSILLKEILGCKIDFSKGESSRFIISQGEKSIEIKNVFFQDQSIKNLYSKDNIPDKTSTNKIAINGASLIYETLYGEPNIELSKTNTVIHFDIIASAFFMLTRWEEAISDQLDQLGRYNAKDALSVRNGFYCRPIINEYAHILLNIFKYMEFNIAEKEYSYEAVVTFDIDQIRKWFSFKQLLISIKDNLIEGKLNYCFKDIASYFRAKNKVDADPYCNFNYIVDSLKKRGIENATFYFKAITSESKYDRNKYSLSSKEIQDAFQLIKTSNYKIGIHPGFLTYDNPNLIAKEVSALAAHASQKINSVRQHYLKFKIPDTWRHQSLNQLTEDSTMIYPHEVGFRNGICQPFQVYDFEKRELMNMREFPLIFMESPYFSKRQKLIYDVAKVTDQVKKYGGVNTILWHNSNLEYPRDRQLYNEALKIIATS